MARKRDYLATRRIRRRMRLVGLSLVVLCIAAGGIFLVRSEIFAIQVVTVTGVPNQYQEPVHAAARQFLASHAVAIAIPEHELFINSQALTQALEKQFPEFERATVRTNVLQRTLTIAPVMRTAKGMLCHPSGTPPAPCAWFDRFGTTFLIRGEQLPSFPSPASSSALIVIMTGETQNGTGHNQIPAELVDSIETIKDLTADTVAWGSAAIAPDELVGKFYRLRAAAGWYALVSYDISPFIAVSHLKKLLGGELRNHESLLEYIDLRYDDKAYYKLR
jgi:hypothetical protein